jgi:hypothetical protein
LEPINPQQAVPAVLVVVGKDMMVALLTVVQVQLVELMPVQVVQGVQVDPMEILGQQGILAPAVMLEVDQLGRVVAHQEDIWLEVPVQ